MPRKPAADMSPADLEAHRQYMRQKKAESRARKVAAGLCQVCSVGQPRDGLVTCDACIAKQNARIAERGRSPRVSEKVYRLIRKLHNQGQGLRTITAEAKKLAASFGREISQSEVKEILDRG